MAHADNPEVSAARENMQMENKYVNRSKGNRAGEAAAGSYLKSLIRRLRNDDLSAYDLAANRYQFNEPEVGSERVDSPGENRERSLVIDSGGGDVTIGESFMRKNGKNGHHPRKK
jgi:hypothetical protein